MKQLFIYFFVLFTLAGCSSDYQRLLKSANYEEKRVKAIELYNNKKYSKAIPLFEELITVFRGTSKAEEIYYYFAKSYFGNKEYLLANYHLSQFVVSYPTSPHAEESAFLSAYCHYLNSPRVELEQTSTSSAINELQYFVNKYPKSTKIDTCNKLVEELRLKLENKAYRNAYLYYNMDYFNSASVLFNQLLKDFPDTKRRPELYFMIVKSGYLYANNSVRKKKKERFISAKENYIKFAEVLWRSKYAKEAEDIYNKITKSLQIIESGGEMATIKEKRDKKIKTEFE